MQSVILYSIASVLVVSLISLIGVIGLAIKAEKSKSILIYIISFAAGALLGDAFIHLLPEVAKKGLSLSASSYILFGIVIFFFLEKVIHWHHYHMPISKDVKEKNHPHAHPFVYTVLFGDALHNFIDGLIIAASYIVSIPVGIATTIAVILHEIPQEIGDFGVLLYGGFSRGKALLVNFLTALTAILGTVVALVLNDKIGGIQFILIPIAIGGFIYVAGSDLIPELHKESGLGKSIIQIIAFIAGIAVMALLLLLE